MMLINNLIRETKKNALIKNSLIIFLGAISISFGNYIFHLFLGRILGPRDYGTLASLLSISVILSIPMGTVQTVIIKAASDLKVKNNYSGLHYLTNYFLKSLSIIGVLFFLLIIICSNRIAIFLKISDHHLIILLGFMLFVSFLIPVTRGLLQGLQLFKSFSINMAAEALIKTVFGITLTLMGLRVYGALWSIIIATVVVFCLSLFPIKFIFNAPLTTKLKMNKVGRYAFPVFLSLLFFTLLYNIDVVLIKHFFSDHDAGLYSALSKLGQIIFFATGSIASVMFPMAAEKYTRGENHHHLLLQSLKIVGLIGGLGVIFYFLFPGFIIHLLFGPSYIIIKPLVGLFALAMFFLSIINIFINYYLSIHRFDFIFLLAITSIIEIILITEYHHSLRVVVYNVLLSLFFLVIGMFILYFTKKNKLQANNS